MAVRIANAPYSWGVEFAGDPRNPDWRHVLRECAEAGYEGIELGPLGYLPDDAAEVGDALDEFGLSLAGGALYRPFSDPAKWDDVWSAATQTCRRLAAHGARQMILVDAISPRRAPTAGRADEAEIMAPDEWRAFADRIVEVARLGREGYGLTVSIHAHAAGFIDFEPEIERLLGETDGDLLKLCLDTGHHRFAGFDPVSFLARHAERVACVHLKDVDPVVRARAFSNRTGFYEACAEGLFCPLGQGDVDFPAVRKVLSDSGYAGWCTVEQDHDPIGPTPPFDGVRRNREYLRGIGL